MRLEGRSRRWLRRQEWSRATSGSAAGWRKQPGPGLILWYPDRHWYRRHAGELAEMLNGLAGTLTRELALPLPPGARCLVMEGRAPRELDGLSGAAYDDMIVLQLPEPDLAVFRKVAAHELAHLCSRALAPAACPFLAEGFACYGAWKVGADRRPFGAPVHHRLAALLERSVEVRLEALWARRGMMLSDGFYELAWSFAVYLEARFGQAGYYEFYRSGFRDLGERCSTVLGMDLEELEEGWRACARERAGGG